MTNDVDIEAPAVGMVDLFAENPPAPPARDPELPPTLDLELSRGDIHLSDEQRRKNRYTLEALKRSKAQLAAYQQKGEPVPERLMRKINRQEKRLSSQIRYAEKKTAVRSAEIRGKMKLLSDLSHLVDKKASAKKLVEHIQASIGNQGLESIPRQRRKAIDWKNIKGGKLQRYKAGHVWVPDDSTLEHEIKRYPQAPKNFFGVWAPPEVYAGAQNADRVPDSEIERPFTDAEKVVAAFAGLENPRELLLDAQLDNEANYIRTFLKPHMPDILAGLVAVAKGVALGEVNEDGVITKVYHTAPNEDIGKYLADHFFGKSAARSNEDGSEAITLDVKGY